MDISTYDGNSSNYDGKKKMSWFPVQFPKIFCGITKDLQQSISVLQPTYFEIWEWSPPSIEIFKVQLPIFILISESQEHPILASDIFYTLGYLNFGKHQHIIFKKWLKLSLHDILEVPSLYSCPVPPTHASPLYLRHFVRRSLYSENNKSIEQIFKSCMCFFWYCPLPLCLPSSPWESVV